MAIKSAVQDGNWSTAATWNTTTNVPTLHASSNVSLATNVTSLGYTAPNTTNAATGVLVYVQSTNNTGTITAELLESGVSKASVVLNTSVLSTLQWNFFKLATPYVFTTVTASAYTWKFTVSSSGSTSLARDSGATAVAYIATDNRTAVPATTDDIFISSPNQTGSITVTVDSSQTIGSGTNVTPNATADTRSLTRAITLGYGATVKWNTSTSATLTCKGQIIVGNGAEWQMGTVASPQPEAVYATLSFNNNGVAGQAGMAVKNGGRLIMQGYPKSSTSLWKTKYVSGSGTAADPLIVADSVNWTVGDEILIAPTGAAGQTEYKFIITKNSATSYVLSNTAGGAEAALSFTHSTDAWVLNVERNVKMNSTVTSLGWWFWNGFGGNATVGNVDIDWSRFETTGTNGTNAFGFWIEGYFSIRANLDYSVFYRPTYWGPTWNFGADSETFTGLIACKQNTTNAVGAFLLDSAATNKSFVDCFAINNNKIGFSLPKAANITMTNCYSIDNLLYGYYLAGLSNGTFTDNESHLNSQYGIYWGGSSDVTFTRGYIGTKGANTTADIGFVSGTFNKGVFDRTSFGSSTLVSGNTTAAAGTLIRFNQLNTTVNNHRWYSDAGAGFAEATTVRSPGLSVRMEPANASTGMTWSFNIPARNNSVVGFSGYLRKNSTFGTSVAKVDLYLPGLIIGTDTPSATYTLPNTTDTWLPVSISATYSGSVDLLATVVITGVTATSGAYLYIDDLYNAGDTTATYDKVTGLEVWDKGQPITIIAPQTPSAADIAANIWAVQTSTLTTSGTTGKQQKDLLTFDDFLGLK